MPGAAGGFLAQRYPSGLSRRRVGLENAGNQCCHVSRWKAWVLVCCDPISCQKALSIHKPFVGPWNVGSVWFLFEGIQIDIDLDGDRRPSNELD
jgi:hypothetical protein